VTNIILGSFAMAFCGVMMLLEHFETPPTC
jgi:hypothetical protein